VDQGLAPLLAVDAGVVGQVGGGPAHLGDGVAHLGDELLALLGRAGDGGDETDVLRDVGEGVRGEGEDGAAGFEDRGQGLVAVRDRGDHEVGAEGEELIDGGGPGVVDDREAAVAQGGDGGEAIAGAGNELIETAEAVKDDGDARLQGRDAHRRFVGAIWRGQRGRRRGSRRSSRAERRFQRARGWD
jgi:hypothetical protein